MTSAAGTAAEVDTCELARCASRVPTPTASWTTAAVISHGTARANRRVGIKRTDRREHSRLRWHGRVTLRDRSQHRDVAAIDRNEHRRAEEPQQRGIGAAGLPRRDIDQSAPPRSLQKGAALHRARRAPRRVQPRGSQPRHWPQRSAARARQPTGRSRARALPARGRGIPPTSVVSLRRSSPHRAMPARAFPSCPASCYRRLRSTATAASRRLRADARSSARTTRSRLRTAATRGI